jgi:putative ABC transport system permease protein
MAKRDAWRYKGRSVLVLIMVALPVGVLVGTLVFATSSSVSSVERIPTSLGRAQALIQGPGEQRRRQYALRIQLRSKPINRQQITYTYRKSKT